MSESPQPNITPQSDFDTHGETFERLVRQKAFLQQVLDINPNFIFAKNRDGRFTLVNQAVAEVYGTTIDQLIGKTDADFNPNEEEVAFFRLMDLEVMNSLQEIVIPEERITDAKGRVRWLQTVKRPIIGPQGVADQVLGVATDITERKRLEEQLRRSQRMEALGFLAGGIAHDFNNLLTVIFGNVDMALPRVQAQPAPDARLLSCLEMILSSARRAESLTRQLLTFSRKRALHPIVLDLNEVLRDLRDLLHRMIGEPISLDMSIHEEPLLIQSDPSQIEQVFMNLVVNARDAMPMGGILRIRTVRCDLDQAYVAAHPGAQTGPHAFVVVSDTGSGIPPQILDRIFDPFFTTKPTGQGTGLGLATVFGIVKQAGGHVTVESEVDRGTDFRIYFPIAEGMKQDRYPASLPTGELSGSETVLVCENQVDVLCLAREILHAHGYEVLSATSAADALRASESFAGPIDLFLTDVALPEMNGKVLAEKLRMFRPAMRVLFMSGQATNASESGTASATEMMLAKPFNAARLLAQVRTALDS